MGKFVLDSKGKAHPIPYEPIAIERNGFRNRFKITDEYGNQFEYHKEGTKTITPNYSVFLRHNIEDEFKLKKIKTSLGEEILYSYTIEKYEYKNLEIPTKYKNLARCGDKNPHKHPEKTNKIDRRLKEISFKEGYIKFFYSDDKNYEIAGSNERKDLKGASALRRVIVYNKNHNIIKDFELVYSYFDSNDGANSDPDRYRLKLDRVIENNKLPYEFIYNKTKGPHRLSKSQDYWGYYGNSSELLPAMTYQGESLGGGDRSVDDDKIKAYSLEKIIYPTGGNKQFYFNEVSYEHNQTEEYIEKKYTEVFSGNGRHNFFLKKSNENLYKVIFNTDCVVEDGRPVFERFCQVELQDQYGNVKFRTNKKGAYPIELPRNEIGKEYQFIISTYDSNNPPCLCSVTLESTEKKERIVLKKPQLPGLRLDRVIKESKYGKPLETKFDYRIPGTNRISNYTKIPGFSFREKSFTTVGKNFDDMIWCEHLVRQGIPVWEYRTTYEYVKEYEEGNGFTQYHFSPSVTTYNNSNNLKLHTGFSNLEGGKLLSKEVYSEKGKKVFMEEYGYSIDYSVNKRSADYLEGAPKAVTFGISFNSPGTWQETCLGTIDDKTDTRVAFKYNIYNFLGGWVKNDSIQKTYFFYDQLGNLKDKKKQTIKYTYNNNNHSQINEIEVSNSVGEKKITQIKYAHELKDSVLISEHRIAIPLETKTFIKDKLVSWEKTVFDYYPNKEYYLPWKLQTSKDGETLKDLKDRIIYHSYDKKGNLTEVSKKSGTHIVYLWGYNYTQPIAKIENATLADIPEELKIKITDLSDNEKDTTSEQTLREWLNKLRAVQQLKKAQITTYTYDPLVGLTSITDPRGKTVFYEYDDFNRLQFIKNSENKILKEYQYNYKN